jgi:mono/diheme cytochrome c family protein
LYAAVTAVLLVLAALRPAHGDVTGSYTGMLRLDAAARRVTVGAALAEADDVVSGTVTVALPAGATVFQVAGRARRRRLALAGIDRLGARLRWRGRVARDGRLRGRLRLRGPHLPHAGVLVLAPAGGRPGGSCGSTAFASTVMGPVMEAVCARCHVPGGAAAAARLRVTPGDPATTEASALEQVDAARPGASRILLKPLGQLGHGGGAVIAPGGPQTQALEAWIALVVRPDCGGGGARPTDGPGLYAAYCASCHGADAGGLDGRPAVRCSKQIADPVRRGRSGAAGDMPPFPDFADAEIALVQGFLESLCPTDAASGADLFAGNCASCHGADAAGGRSGAGVRGPDVRCKDADAFQEKVSRGDDEMPAFPELPPAAIARIAAFVAGLCTD